MKPQDLFFIVLLAIVVLLQKPRLFAWVGVICLAASFVLYTQWIFFTAQRLVMYAACFFLCSTIFSFLRKSKVQ